MWTCGTLGGSEPVCMSISGRGGENKRLAGGDAVLHGYVESVGFVDLFNHLTDLLDGQEEVCHLFGREVF